MVPSREDFALFFKNFFLGPTQWKLWKLIKVISKFVFLFKHKKLIREQ